MLRSWQKPTDDELEQRGQTDGAAFRSGRFIRRPPPPVTGQVVPFAPSAMDRVADRNERRVSGRLNRSGEDIIEVVMALLEELRRRQTY